MTANAGPFRSVGSRRANSKWVTILLFLAPALALYVLFVMVPVVQGAYYSLFKWRGFGGLDPSTFYGLGNFQRAFADSTFQMAIKNNFLLLIASICLQIPFALALAVFLNQRFRGRTLFRIVFFLPYVLAEVTTGIVFYLLLDPYGLVNKGLGAVGLSDKTPWLGNVNVILSLSSINGWLPDITVAMLALFLVISWKYFGFHMIILLAGLQGIPREVYEAAVIDGANRWQAFRFVTLPLLGPTLRVSVFLSAIGALQIFDMVWVMTRGGPVGTTSTMGTFIYDHGFFAQQMGYGSAVSVILFAICLVLALLYQRFVMRRDTEGAITMFEG
jgi:raffinose/stachyose/melibiose transport system permease protein